MPPIDLFKNSAINASKASAITPQTAGHQHVDAPPTTPTTSTTSYVAPSYPAARPAAPAVPAPTAATQRFVPADMQPTLTTTSDQPFAPAPQPGAVPVPLTTPVRSKSDILPPPKAGEANILPPGMGTAPSPHYPPQMYVPPPTTNYNPPPSSTSTATVSASSYPVPFPTSQYEYGARQSSDGPPGYRQNPYASDLTPDQRRAQDALGDDGDSDNTSGATSIAADVQSAWDTAKQWAQKAEREVWKKVNK